MYLSWTEKKINNFGNKNINSLYGKGFVFTRLGRGIMNKTRSVRINLDKFELNSENRRILKKGADIELEKYSLPFKEYNWKIGKLGFDFYKKKFGEKVFTANKIKSLITEPEENNFNTILKYNDIAYCICLETDEILHYSYPFYNLTTENKNIGMIMMTKAIQWAKENDKKYVYLGSASRPSDTYKFQFSGIEWFDKINWSNDIKKIKETLKNL